MLSKTLQSKIDLLDSNRGKIYSATGGWKPGKGVYTHGYSMLEELIGKTSYFQIMILNATGKLVDRALADWIEATYGCLSWPDARIWCNQIGALAGSSRVTSAAATTMGCLAADARGYGPYTMIEGLRFIQSAYLQHAQGMSAKTIVDEEINAHGGKPHIMGYVRPIAKGDERIEVMENVTREKGFSIGPHLTLAYEIEQELMDRFNESMNINGFASAFLSDQGFTPDEAYQTYCTAVMSGVTACYLETKQKPKGSFLPLKCSDIEYAGEPPRTVGEFREAQRSALKTAD